MNTLHPLSEMYSKRATWCDVEKVEGQSWSVRLRAETTGAVLAGACSFSQMGGEMVYPVCRVTLLLPKGLALKNQMTLQKRGAKIRRVDDSWTPMHVSPSPPHTTHTTRWTTGAREGYHVQWGNTDRLRHHSKEPGWTIAGLGASEL